MVDFLILLFCFGLLTLAFVSVIGTKDKPKQKINGGITMTYYLHDIEHATVKEIKLNDFINTIALYIKINFLMFGIYKSVKTNKKEYQIISLFDNEIIYIINTKKEV